MALSSTSLFSARRALIPLLLLGACLAHRSAHLYLLWPELVQLFAGEDNIMQLIPAQVWREHFTAAWFYLQQSPPVPNFLFGVLAWLINDQQQLALSIFIVQIVLAGAGIALFSSLLLRLRLPVWMALLFPAVLYFGADLFVMEYNAMGHFYYEHSTLVLCLLASHIALSYQRTPNVVSALKLGIAVAVLALTRSTFAYLAVPVALWLLLSGPLNWRYILAYVLPVVFLQGGWALKNYAVHDFWSVASSTWGGANARTGDIRRSGGKMVVRWMSRWERENEIFCDKAYWEMAKQYKWPVFLFTKTEWMLSFPQPEEVLAENQRVTDARGRMVFYDTATFRHYSQCMQKVYLRYWLSHPRQTFKGVYRSYKLFWLPMREFAVRNPIPIAPPDYGQKNYPTPVVWLERAVQELSGGGYRSAHLDLDKWPTPYSYGSISLVLLPALPYVLHTLNFFVVHLAVLGFVLAALFRFRRLRESDAWQLSFPILLCLYVAALTSLVEFGENMRFRIEVEPLIWTLSAAALYGLWKYCRRQFGGAAE